MATVQEAKRSDVKLDKESLFEQAKTFLNEHARVEAARLNEDVTARQVLLKAMKPEERTRLFDHLKTARSEAAPVIRRDFQLPLPTCIDYQVLRPPFTDWWAQEPRLIASQCVNSLTGQQLDLCAFSQQAIAAEGTLSVEAAIGDFFNARCQRTKSWFIGEANQATAAIGLTKDTGIVPTGPGFITVEVDLVLDGQPSGWTYFMFPGEPGSGLGLVGSLGIADLTLQVRDVAGVRETYERFLLESASAYFPGDLDRKPSFTLSVNSFLPVNNTAVAYSFAVSVELTAFRSVPVVNGGYPGYVQANLTVPGTPGMLGPGTPLRVKEVRTAICLL